MKTFTLNNVLGRSLSFDFQFRSGSGHFRNDVNINTRISHTLRHRKHPLPQEIGACTNYKKIRSKWKRSERCPQRSDKKVRHVLFCNIRKASVSLRALLLPFVSRMPRSTTPICMVVWSRLSVFCDYIQAPLRSLLTETQLLIYVNLTTSGSHMTLTGRTKVRSKVPV